MPDALPLRVVVADDQASMRLLLRFTLDVEDAFEVVGEADNGAAAIELVHAAAPDLLVIDVDMPYMDGIEAIHALRRDPCGPGIVAFSASVGHATAHTLDSLGVELVLKDDDPDLLVQALHRAALARDATLTDHGA